jgi:AcrR family transcriptional regulator
LLIYFSTPAVYSQHVIIRQQERTPPPTTARRERTRERLLAATMELMRKEGVAAVTVSRLAREVGVHHTLFYSHFKTIDACLAAAAQQVLDVLTPVDDELRARFFRSDINDRAALESMFADMLARWLEHREFVGLLLAHRFDASAFGAAVRPGLARMRQELSTGLWRQAVLIGVHHDHRPEIDALADLHAASWLWAVETLIDGRGLGLQATARLLADATYGAVTQVLRRTLARPRDAMLEARFTPEEREHLRRRRVAWAQQLTARTHHDVIRDHGGEERTIDTLLEMVVDYFIPEAAGAATVISGYEIEVSGGSIRRWLQVRDGRCSVLREAPKDAAHFSARTSLPVLLQLVSGLRTYGEAFTSGDAVLTGDVLLCAEFVAWFYQPSSAAERSE